MQKLQICIRNNVVISHVYLLSLLFYIIIEHEFELTLRYQSLEYCLMKYYRDTRCQTKGFGLIFESPTTNGYAVLCTWICCGLWYSTSKENYRSNEWQPLLDGVGKFDHNYDTLPCKLYWFLFCCISFLSIKAHIACRVLGELQIAIENFCAMFLNPFI